MVTGSDYRMGVATDVLSDLGYEPVFHVILRRWVIERAFSWLRQLRQLSKDYERLACRTEALIYLVAIRLLLARLAAPVPARLGEDTRIDPLIPVCERLQEAAERDLGDWFVFHLGAPITDLDAAPYGGARFPVEVVLAARRFAASTSIAG